MLDKRQQIAGGGSLLIGHYTTFLDTTFNSAFGDEYTVDFDYRK